MSINSKKPLPKLIKMEDTLMYSVSADNIIDKKSGREVFVFCVAAHFDNVVHFIQSGTIVNEFSGKHYSPFDDYLRELSSYYNCKVIYETD